MSSNKEERVKIAELLGSSTPKTLATSIDKEHFIRKTLSAVVGYRISTVWAH